MRINTYHWQLKALQTMPELNHKVSAALKSTFI